MKTISAIDQESIATDVWMLRNPPFIQSLSLLLFFFVFLILANLKERLANTWHIADVFTLASIKSIGRVIHACDEVKEKKEATEHYLKLFWERFVKLKVFCVRRFILAEYVNDVCRMFMWLKNGARFICLQNGLN